MGWYCPDFWLPAHKTYIEVKGPIPTPNELEKLRALWNYHDQNVTCAILREIPTCAAESPFPGGDATPFFFPARAYVAKRDDLLLLLADNDSARLAAAYDAARNYQFLRTNIASEQEIERLKAENKRLKAENERLAALAQGSQTTEDCNIPF